VESLINFKVIAIAMPFLEFPGSVPDQPNKIKVDIIILSKVMEPESACSLRQGEGESRLVIVFCRKLLRFIGGVNLSAHFKWRLDSDFQDSA
jgi:hypothetical protein